MRGAERSARNTAKNISLIVLVVLMAVLCAANWLAGVSAASLDSDTLLRRAHDRLFGGAAATRSVRPAFPPPPRRSWRSARRESSWACSTT